MVTISRPPVYKTDYFIHQIPSLQLWKWTRSVEGEARTSTHPANLMSNWATSFDSNFIQMVYMVETRLRSNSNNLELHEAGNACWVLHSNNLTDSNDSRIFLWKTRESKMKLECIILETKKSLSSANYRLPTPKGDSFWAVESWPVILCKLDWTLRGSKFNWPISFYPFWYRG